MPLTLKNFYVLVPLNPISDLTVVGGDTEATITWTDPVDLASTTWVSTKLVRKVGSAPVDSTDGTLVVTETVRDTYSVSGYNDTGLTNGTTYYYAAFAVGNNGLETISSTTPNVTPVGYILPSGCLAYYPLQSDANDHKADFGGTGTTYNGTWSGTAAYGEISGKKGATFSSNSYIDTGIQLGTKPLSFAVSMLRPSIPSGWWTSFSLDKSNNPGYGIFGQETQIMVHCGDSTDTAVVSNYSANVWYNLVVTVNSSGTVKYYLNGSYVGSKSRGTTITGYNWTIGKGINNYFNGGYTAHCALWNRELTADEVAEFNTYINS